MDEAKDPVGGIDDGGLVRPIANEELKYVFKSGRDYFPAKPYADDGNTDLYSNEALQEREALRTNPNVRAAITKFASENFAFSGGANKFITKEEYMKVFVQVGTILRPGMDTDQLMEFIRDDFESDCQPKKRLTNKTQSAPRDDDDDSKPGSAAAAAENEEQQRPPA